MNDGGQGAGMRSKDFAGIAIAVRCPRCGIEVRSCAQLRDDALDLAVRVATAAALARGEGSRTARLAYGAMVEAARVELAEMEAELAGHHLDCSGFTCLN